jgi:hypothetical protein
MTQRATNWLPTLMGTGLLLGMVSVGCGGSTADEHGTGDAELDGLKGSTSSALLRARDCGDLLEKLKLDALVKAKLAAARARLTWTDYSDRDHGGVGVDFDEGEPRGDGDSAGGDLGALPPTAPADDNAGNPGAGPAPTGEAASDGDAKTDAPTGASNTNTQVEGVDEADFVKVVKQGEAMFVLNGNTLYKVKTWPAADLSLGAKLEIEGSPSEMFVTDAGKAVVFSTVYGYTTQATGSGGDGDSIAVGGKEPGYDLPCAPVDSAMGGERPPEAAALAADVAPGYYGGCGGYAQPSTKITVVDVSGDAFKAERELYYEGNYVSSRRYDDVVRVVLQAGRTPAAPTSVDGNVYYDEKSSTYNSRREFERELDKWLTKVEGQIDTLTLEDFLPQVQEANAEGKLAEIAPACNDFYIPVAGQSDYGITEIVSLDLAKAGAPQGVTIMGAAQTVYSNLEHIVLAQPDYRWGPAVDFGFVDEQLTNLHLFSIAGAATNYEASGFVSGMLPPNNAQFGIDVKNGVIRVATTGRTRTNPKADPETQEFWATGTENHVITLEQKGPLLAVLGKSVKLGLENESIQSARFVGDRAYVVTFLQTDPLVVVDVKDPKAPTFLGEIKIPGFSQYMHPLDDNHLITLGTTGEWGTQLQLFDVTDPLHIPTPKTLDFGSSSSSEGQYNHKAFTFFREQNLLALPVYSYGSSSEFSSTLRLIKVDAQNGFSPIGAVDHSALYTTQTDGCVKCYEGYCEYACYNYAPEVRRGHFVTSEDKTYVYSFSYAGVIVNDLADLNADLATVSFPAPAWDNMSWYGSTTPVSSGNNGVMPAAGTTTTPADGATMTGGGSSPSSMGG